MMEEAAIRANLSQPDDMVKNTFAVLKGISHLANDVRTADLARDLVIRTLAIKESISPSYYPIIESLVRSVGLFPYADTECVIDLEDQVLLEAHRTPSLGPKSFFHRLQLDVYRELVVGRNVILSATTSVGKTRVIDAFIANNSKRRIVLIVPTIALIDETRRRLSVRFGEHYDIVTHPSQKTGDDSHPTIYILTQERALARNDLQDIDFVVIDEFYKLDIRKDQDERAIDLNLCFHKFAEMGAQFYLIGPHINAVQGLPSRYKHTFLPSNFSTVALDITSFNLKRDDNEGRKSLLLEILSELKTPTLVYCQSPSKAREAAEALIDFFSRTEDAPHTNSAVDWLEENYPAEWVLIKALRKGIGIHHGNVPRAIQQYMVRAFEVGEIKILVCTSTIIEGVNTVAENVIIYDRRLNSANIDYFTFRNIAGRAGRMAKYFIGKVFVLEEPPEKSQQTVELPVENQSENTPMSLLLGLPREALNDISRKRVDELLAGSPLSPETLRENRYIPIETQNSLYAYLSTNFSVLQHLLVWSGVPSPEQSKFICGLIYEFIDGGRRLNRHRISSGDALNAELTALSVTSSFREYIDQRVTTRWEDEDVTDAVERILKFLRNYLGHDFGRQLNALSKIQEEICIIRGVRPGNYGLYAARVESLFMPSGLYALDEYGLPLEVARRLAKRKGDFSTLNSALRLISNIAPDAEDFHPFERELIRSVQSGLPTRIRA